MSLGSWELSSLVLLEFLEVLEPNIFLFSYPAAEDF